MQIKLLTAALAVAVAAFVALPAMAAAEGGPTIRWEAGEDPVLPPVEVDTNHGSSSMVLTTSAKGSFFPSGGTINCPIQELNGNIESNEGPTAIAFESARFEGELPPGTQSCNTTIASPFGGTLHARVTVNGETGGWTHEFFNGETGEFPSSMAFKVLFAFDLPLEGWKFFAECVYSKTGVETTHEVAPQPLVLQIPSQEMAISGMSAGACPAANLSGFLTLKHEEFEGFTVSNP